jgi:hypothetical protein
MQQIRQVEGLYVEELEVLDTVLPPLETAATTCKGTNSNKHGELKNHQSQ